MGWYDRDGARLYYEDSGHGDPVVLLPGWAGSITDLDRLRRALHDDFRVIAVDLPGCGRSQPQPRSYPPSFYVDDARTFLDLLDHLGLESAHLVGFSDGGECALLMAALAPRRALSVLTWGAVGRMVSPPGRLAALERLIDSPSEPFLELAAYLAEAYGVDNARAMAASWARALGAIIEAGGDVSRSRAAQITCPARLIVGTYDPYCPPELVRDMADAVPRGEFVELEAGHDVHHSHAAWLTTAVLQWLESH